MLVLTLDRGRGGAVYEQLADQLRRFVTTGELRPGTALPSVRRLAGDLGVSLNTIARAYRRLEREGFLTIRDRAGVVVLPPASKVATAERARLREQMRATIARLGQAGFSAEEIANEVQTELRALGRRTGETK